MNAVWMAARSQIRSRARSTVAAVVLLGLAGGLVLTILSGARRTDSAYGRFLAWSNADAVTIVDTGGVFGFAGVDLERVLKLPQVAESAMAREYLFSTPEGSTSAPGQGAAQSIPSQNQAAALDRPKVLEGRLPSQDRIDEVAVGYASAKVTGVRVGDRLTMKFIAKDVNPNQVFDLSQLPESAFGATIRATVTAIVMVPGDIPTGSNEGYGDVYLTAAFDRAYGAKVWSIPGVLVRLGHGSADVGAFKREVDSLADHPGRENFLDSRDTTAIIQRHIHLLAVSLQLFGLVAGLATVLMFGQAIARQVHIGASEDAPLVALGMTRAQRIGVSMARATVTAIAGAVIAAVVAILLSPLTPLGTARVVEPFPGFHVDVAVVAVGGAIIGAIVLLLAGIAGWQASSPARRSASAGRPSPVSEAIARAGFPATAVVGIRMAFEPGRGRTAVPVRATALSVTLAVAAVVVGSAFVSSFHHLLATPRLYGNGWDVEAGNEFSGDLSAKGTDIVERDPAVTQFSVANLGEIVNVAHAGRNTTTGAIAVQPVRGLVTPPMLQGRWPGRIGEIALGAKTARDLQARVGDVVTLNVADQQRKMRVAGIAVVPELTNSQGLGEGVALSIATLERLGSEVSKNVFLIRLRPGADRTAATMRLDAEFRKIGGIAAGAHTPEQGTALTNLAGARGLPLTLAAVLGVLALGSLSHALVSSVRRRRRDLAVLKALGFVRRQVAGTVAWQASALVAIGILVGLPAGAIAARWAWRLFANQVGFVPAPTLPVPALILAAAAAIVLGNLVATVPARIAARTRPALVLRSE